MLATFRKERIQQVAIDIWENFWDCCDHNPHDNGSQESITYWRASHSIKDSSTFLKQMQELWISW